jgi:hypothetical protein
MSKFRETKETKNNPKSKDKQLRRISNIDIDYADNDIDDILRLEIGEVDDVSVITTAQSSSPELISQNLQSFNNNGSKKKFLMPIQDPAIGHFTCLYIEKQNNGTNKIIYIDPRGSGDKQFSQSKLEEITKLVGSAGIEGNIEVSKTPIQLYSDKQPNNSCGAYVCDLLVNLVRGNVSINGNGNLKTDSKEMRIESYDRSIEIAQGIREKHNGALLNNRDIGNLGGLDIGDKKQSGNEVSSIIKGFEKYYLLSESAKSITKEETKLRNQIKRKKITPGDAKEKQASLEESNKRISAECDDLFSMFSWEKNEKSKTSVNLGKFNQFLVEKLCEPQKENDITPWEMTNNVSDSLKSSDIDKEIYGKIMGNVQLYFADMQRAVPHQKRIQTFLKNKFDTEIEEEDIKPNGDKGKNDGFIVNMDDKKYFIKTCAGKEVLGLGNDDGKIHPSELFVYKVMEYTGFGPKAQFLIQSYSSFGNSTKVAHGNYIMTEMVPNLHHDKEEEKEVFARFISSDNKDSAVNLSSASLLSDLLSLIDVFAENPGNYGITTENKDSKLQFVDHLPGNNGYFGSVKGDVDKLAQYSPRTRLQNRCKTTTSVNLQDLSASHGKWEKLAIAKDVNKRIFGDRDDGTLPLGQAMQKAEKDIKSLMGQHPGNFTSKTVHDMDYNEIELSSTKILDIYLRKINSNIATYEKTDYQKSASSDDRGR